MNKNILVGLVAVAALVVGGLAYAKVPTKVVGGTGAQGERGLAGKDGEKGAKGDKGDRGDIGPSGPAGRDGKNSATQILGSATGPDTYFTYTANNNLQKYGLSKGFSTGSTTVCAIQGPSATSTLTFGSATFITSSTTNSVVTLAKATTPYATTTPLTNIAISANAQGTVMASSTPLLATGAIGNEVFAPNSWFVVSMADATPEGGAATFSPTGSCSAEFTRN